MQGSFTTYLYQWPYVKMLVQQPDEGIPLSSANRELERIFARPEFQEPRPGVFGFLTEWLREFFDWVSSLFGSSPVLFWIILIICLVLLALLLLHMGLTVYRVFHLERVDRQSLHSTARQLLSAEYIQQANKAAQAQEYTEAIRCLFLALVYHYDENNEFVFKPALTNREYLAGFADQPQLAEQLTGFVDTIDQHWYGMMSCSQSIYQQHRSIFDRLCGRRGRY